jgi:hypothetical protein
LTPLAAIGLAHDAAPYPALMPTNPICSRPEWALPRCISCLAGLQLLLLPLLLGLTTLTSPSHPHQHTSSSSRCLCRRSSST